MFDPHLVLIHQIKCVVTFSYDQICEDGFSTVFLSDVVPGASIVQYEHAWIFPGPSLRFTLWKG